MVLIKFISLFITYLTDQQLMYKVYRIDAEVKKIVLIFFLHISCKSSMKENKT